MQFTELQMRILKFIAKKPRTYNEIADHFPELGERFSDDPWYATMDPIIAYIDTGVAGDPNAKITLTHDGKAILEGEKKDKRQFWLQNLTIPIIVSFATTVLTNALLPLLQELLELLWQLMKG